MGYRKEGKSPPGIDLGVCLLWFGVESVRPMPWVYSFVLDLRQQLSLNLRT